MKKIFLTVAVVALTGMQAFAFNKTEDGHLLFICKSLPNVDSAITVVGVADELLAEVQLVIMVAGEVEAEDRGVLVSNTSRYEGSIFDMNFGDTVTITAKAQNAVLSVGQSDSLICELN
ncbi:hypothetical protein D3C72_1313970 [compost metagenome]